MSITAEEYYTGLAYLKAMKAVWGCKPKGEVYGLMCPPEDSFEASDYGNWFPVWYRVVDDYGHGERITEAEAKAHFEALGQKMPKPEAPRR